MPVHEFIAQASSGTVRVRSPHPEMVRDLLTCPQVTITRVDRGAIDVDGMTCAEIGDRAAAAGLVLHELSPQQASLEAAFMELTRNAVEYHATADRKVST
jgi:ABC-2 type transport system ATP-binding protein